MNCLTPDNKLTEGCFETILETMAEAVCVVDTECIIRYCNRAMSAMSGLQAEQIIGRPCNELMVCSCKSPEECPIFKGEPLHNVECDLKRRDRAPLPVLKSGAEIKDGDGAISGAVETLTDISALRRNEIRLAELEASIRRRSGAGGIIGSSHVMQQIFELIEMAAASQATVLVTGETGTGKELVAQAIHDLSGRRKGPLIKINCSALPESLLESELFGHVRGAFTGAVQDKTGRFELADGGTIFLDEIGDVSPLIQVKLLRFLQEREFERVGESSTRKADVRIIAATNKHLLEEIRKGTFRDDLYYRLKVFPIHLPPLRERKEDIGPLINHFIAKFNRETGKE
ncbi:MAG: PAS domain-containing protein, partial [Chitinivibrionales bacterium]|nr:PAS domain-containing protein [Chitinivibrionales bacterium]